MVWDDLAWEIPKISRWKQREIDFIDLSRWGQRHNKMWDELSYECLNDGIFLTYCGCCFSLFVVWLLSNLLWMFALSVLWLLLQFSFNSTVWFVHLGSVKILQISCKTNVLSYCSFHTDMMVLSPRNTWYKLRLQFVQNSPDHLWSHCVICNSVPQTKVAWEHNPASNDQPGNTAENKKGPAGDHISTAFNWPPCPVFVRYPHKEPHKVVPPTWFD